MINKILFTTIVASSILGAMDYGMAVESIKKPEAIATVAKGSDMTMNDVSNSVDKDKLTTSIMGSKAKTNKDTSSIDYGMAADSIKKQEAMATVAKGSDMTMNDVSNSVDKEKLAKSVMGSSDGKKAQSKITKVTEDKKTKETINSVKAGHEIGKSMGLY